MTDQLKRTVAAEVALPIESVQLEHLRTKTGEPVFVRCEALDELKISDLMKALPGERPKPIEEENEPEPEETIRSLDRYAPALIEAGTTLEEPDGAEIRPAFWFTEPKPGALPGRLLRVGDRVKLVTTIMRLSGYLGGAAQEAGFHDEGRAGRNDGMGAVAPGARDGDAAPSAPESDLAGPAGAGI